MVQQFKISRQTVMIERVMIWKSYD